MAEPPKGRANLRGVFCSVRGSGAPHCSKRSRRLMRRKVLARCTGSCGPIGDRARLMEVMMMMMLLLSACGDCWN